MKSKKEEYKKIDINTKSGVSLFPGRRKCECMAQDHKLINNCLTCGRLVCEQEGEGDCFFCGNPVYSKSNPMYEDLIKNQFVSLDDAQSIDAINKKKAIEHKNKLLNYDRNVAPQSNIIDEEADWYEISNDIWLNKNQRDFAEKKFKEELNKKEEDKKGINLTFDTQTMSFAVNDQGNDNVLAKQEAQAFMQINVNQPKINEKNQIGDDRLVQDQQNIMKELKAHMEEKYKEVMANLKKTSSDSKKDVAPKYADITGVPQSKRVQHDSLHDEFKEALEKLEQGNQDENNNENENIANLYDSAIYDISLDGGACFSMHQPWASLVIFGFKRFEGRFWTSKYRGPLWIQAGSKVPTQEEIDIVEQQYKHLYKNVKNLPSFPERYPTGSLLGLVDLEEIIPRDLYEKAIKPEYREESSCDYLFVMRNPRKLLYPIKYPGQKQIFRIDNESLLETARKNLIKVRTNWYPYFGQEIKVLLDQQKEHEDIKEKEGEDIKMTLTDFEKLKLTYKIEEPGAIVYDLLNVQEQLKLIEYLIGCIKGLKPSKLNGKNNMQTIPINKENEILNKIYNCIPYVYETKFNDDKKLLAKRLKNIDFVFLGDKEKEFLLIEKYRVYINFGKSIKLRIEDNDTGKRKSSLMKHSSIFVRNDDCEFDIVFDGIDAKSTGNNDKDNDNLKQCNKKLESYTLLMLFYE